MAAEPRTEESPDTPHRPDAPHIGEIKKLGVAGDTLYEESLQPGVERAQVSPGDQVVTADDEQVGEVRFVRPNCVVVSRGRKADLYVPFDAVLSSREHRVVVNTLATQIDRLGWETPPSR
ncbi:MAG: hypothetical protein AVDCRST_MAG77-2726 [uncultured Chloroflexi bacterium]|uniref:Uncharacterized protein n=1 Tax=uncultured Chloroflexota bacterium TaxID=166587 RepID=A0A6J4IYV7_9CHLR|nr:MAG: hypothetical protein AVDCRST_MAG77-2726 [uncultured Chloroflexota bacterium]